MTVRQSKATAEEIARLGVRHVLVTPASMGRIVNGVHVVGRSVVAVISKVVPVGDWFTFETDLGLLRVSRRETLWLYHDLGPQVRGAIDRTTAEYRRWRAENSAELDAVERELGADSGPAVASCRYLGCTLVRGHASEWHYTSEDGVVYEDDDSISGDPDEMGYVPGSGIGDHRPMPGERDPFRDTPVCSAHGTFTGDACPGCIDPGARTHCSGDRCITAQVGRVKIQTDSVFGEELLVITTGNGGRLVLTSDELAHLGAAISLMSG